MDMDLYLHHYRTFHGKYFPNVTIWDKRHKLYEEAMEFVSEYENEESPSEQKLISEALDLLNTSVSYLVASGIKDPLQAGYLKLQETSAKYERMKNGTTDTTTKCK